jgi:ribonuclease HI
LLKLKVDQEFVWGPEQQLALDKIKKYLTNPLVLVPPQHRKPIKLYLSTDDTVIGSALIQEFKGKERVIYYQSRRLVDAETRYSGIEKLCLCLYFSCIKLRYYLLSAECTVICKDDVAKYMLSMPILSGRIGKWILALSNFDLHYESAKAVKGQIMANFVTQHCNTMDSLEVAPCTLLFDGSTCDQGAGIGIVLISPRGRKYEFSLPIVATSINKQVEYQALVKGLELLREIRADAVVVFADSMLVINQLIGIYECQSEVLILYYERCLQLLREFKDLRLEYIPRLHNDEANRLAQHASRYQRIQEVLISTLDADDSRTEIADYLRDPSKKVERRVRFQATKYVLLDNELYYRTLDGVLLRCLGNDESKSLMGEIHEGVCGAHC